MNARIRVLYKSGGLMDFTVSSFSITPGPGGTLEYEWEAIGYPAPIMLNPSEVEAVWQIGVVA
jgi:hypothetical protein